MTDAQDAPAFGFRAQTIEQFEASVAPLLGPVVKSQFRGRFVHEFMGAIPERDWLLKGVFLARTFNVIYGAGGSGKSFLMLDLVMSMALAIVDDRAPKEWFGRRIKPCGVIYMAGEGQDDFIIRMYAWLEARGLKPTLKLPVFLIPTAIDLRSGVDSAKALVDEIRAASAVMRAEFGCDAEMNVFDTLNKNLAGGDDSKPEHAGQVMKNYQFIREETRTAVVAVHHTSKVGSDPRGHSSIRFDNDGDVFVVGPHEGAPNSWTVKRQKAGPAGDRHEFRLRQFEVARDRYGDAVTSCIVAPGAAEQSRDAAEVATQGKPNMTADGRVLLQAGAHKFMRILNDLIRRKEKEFDRPAPLADVRIPHGRVAVQESELFEEIVRSSPGYVEPAADGANKAEVDKHRDRARKTRDAALMKLPERGLIGMDKGWVWRTGKRVAGIDRPEHDEIAPSRVNPSDLGLTEEDVDKMF